MTRLSDPSILLTAPFVQGVKSRCDLQVGIEWEKLGVDASTGNAAAYSGPRGVEKLFGELMKAGWESTLSHEGRPLALRKGGSSITLEPGGQVELSGRKALSLRSNESELRDHLREIASISAPLGIAWLGLGVQPFSTASEIERVPKERYRLMDAALNREGLMTHRMMKETASIQVSVDYTSEEDAMLKLRLALALSPVITGVFAHSPAAGGKLTGYLSERALIWSRTAPERSGLIREAFEEGFSFERYAAFALKVPALFIIREGRWIPLDGKPFQEFLANGFGAFRATAEDWELHLTTIFTDARLKNYVEIRSADCQSPEVGLALAAFLKGLFYHGPAAEEAWRRLRSIPCEEFVRSKEEASRLGPAAELGPKRVLDWARELLELSRSGLAALVASDPRCAGDDRYLGPMEDLLRTEECPAMRLRARIEKDGLLPAVLACCRLA